MKTVTCLCGHEAEVLEWNSKGIMVRCPNCGTFDRERDDLYKFGMYYGLVYRRLCDLYQSYESMAKDNDLEDGYREMCGEVAFRLDELTKDLLERHKEQWQYLEGEE